MTTDGEGIPRSSLRVGDYSLETKGLHCPEGLCVESTVQRDIFFGGCVGLEDWTAQRNCANPIALDPVSERRFD